MPEIHTTRFSAWRWAWTQTVRDLRGGSLRLMLLAVMLAVAALSAVAFFADRIEQGLHRDAAQLLGGDVVVVGDQPLPDSFERAAAASQLKTAKAAIFQSMARSPDERGGESKLVSVKAVSEDYPLKGRLRIGVLDAHGRLTQVHDAPQGGPSAGQVWVDAGLLVALDLRVGDAIWLGDASFKVAAVIATEPDRGAGFTSFAPRVMIRQSDLASTQLIQPASRVTYRLYAAAGQQKDERMRVDRFAKVSESLAESVRGVRVETLEQGRPEMRTTLDRAALFLRLVALLAALMSAVAVAMVSRDFAQRRLDDCALLRVMGVSQTVMARTYFLEFLMVGVGASALGLLVGWGFHLVFVSMLAELVGVSLPPAGWQPVGLGMGVGVLLTLGFGLPPVLQLAKVPPLRVLRRDLGGLRPLSGGVAALGGVALVGLLMAVARDIKLGGVALGGFVAAVALFAVLAMLMVLALRALIQRMGARVPTWLALASRQLTAQPGQTVVQVCALGVGLLALMLLVLIRTDLVDSWRAATPADAPDRFVINILPDQVEPFQRALKQAGVAQYDWYPMVRARLVAVNGKPVKAKDYPEERAQRLVEREFNMSYAAQPPVHNPVVAGQWVPNEANAFSVEQGLASALGLQRGDRLLFDMAGVSYEGRITTLRKVDWSSMRVNFFVMAPVADMPQWPATYITAFRMPPGQKLDRTLVQQFPNVSVVDVSATLRQIQDVLEQVIAAVEFLFVFTLVAGLMVLMAGLMSSRERRGRDWAILRALGATQSMLARVQRVELLLTGALAGALAASAALSIGWVLATRVFEFEWHAPLWWPLAGALIGALLSWLAGWWSLRGVLQRPVTTTLRQVD
ncbi:MAG: ABC transporter permease [Aquabacterium sp.]|uniref:ABC transporter permease n=1 Tax=Aquabacterium sp. TaxID=1872578 RepID=UPI003BCFF41C